MRGRQAKPEIHPRVVDALYLDAMLLADEARGYFEEEGRAERDLLGGSDRVSFSCESLRVTTRLMHVIAWLLTRRAVEAGEITAEAALHPSRRLGHDTGASAPSVVRMLPPRARALVEASIALHRRASLLDAAFAAAEPAPSPARAMQQRLAAML